MFGTPQWKKSRGVKLALREDALNAADSLLDQPGTSLEPSEGIAIIRATSKEIVQGIADNRWTATQVITLFIRESKRAHAATNALTEVMYASALRRAGTLDADFARTGELVGPLHGVPVSLKDQMQVADFDSTIGFTHWSGKPAEQDGVLASVLIKAGAIPFVKTNVPQTMLAFECANPLFGATNNPYDATRTCGGSSGGEAALLASDGCPLGFGSDIGGSLRIPAHYSGCYGLKPCHSRFPTRGSVSSSPGFESIKTSFGPMGRSVADLELGTRAVVDASVELSRVEGLVPLPYRDVKLPEKLKFGYYLTDGFCRASPACERAVLETVAALQKQGHECVEFEPLDPVRALKLFVGLSAAGGYDTLLGNLEGDPQESSLFLTTIGPKIPSLLRPIISFLIRNLLGDAIFAGVFESAKRRTVTDMQDVAHQRDLYVAEFRKHVFGTLGLDAIICAPQAIPAVKHGQSWDLSVLALGTLLYNLVDSTAAVIPVTFVNSVRDAVTPEWLARKSVKPGSKVIEQKVFGEGGVYNAKEMDGIPVGVQVVGAMWEEEKLIEILKVVDDALGPRGFGPGEFVHRIKEDIEAAK